jgi:ArsR family transcriptional regulator, repressor of sdpIR and other operons
MCAEPFAQFAFGDSRNSRPHSVSPQTQILAPLANYLILFDVQSVFRALADPTRRDILQLLRDGPRTSGEIAEHFPSAWATVSRHLGVLRDAGLILSERHGQQIVYELNTTVFDDVVEQIMQWASPSSSGRKRA